MKRAKQRRGPSPRVLAKRARFVASLSLFAECSSATTAHLRVMERVFHGVAGAIAEVLRAVPVLSATDAQIDAVLDTAER